MSTSSKPQQTGRRGEHLIRDVRRDTGNESYGTGYGIQQRDIARYLSDAQKHIQAAIVNVGASARGAFSTSALLDVVAGTADVACPNDMMMEGGIIKAQLSPSGSATDFRDLSKMTEAEVPETYRSTPLGYTRHGTSIALSPIPDATIAGGLRIKYIQRLPDVDLRRGTVSAVTLDTSARTITSLTLVTGATLDATGLAEDDFICVVDFYGRVKMAGIPITAVDSGTGVVTTLSGHVYDVGETIAVGDYVVSGRWASSHSLLPPTVERFLVMYASKRCARRDSSDDSVELTKEEQEMVAEIAESWAGVDPDATYIPDTNSDGF